MHFVVLLIIVISKFVDTKRASTYCQMGNNIESINSTVLPIQTLISMEKDQRIQYHFQINVPTTIKITFSSCTNFITSKLYYNQSIQISKASSSSSVIIQCAPIGRYDIELQARHACAFEMKTILHHPNENWSLLNLIESSKFNYQNRIKKREMVVKWNKRSKFNIYSSKLDIHAVHYCLVINTKRNQPSLCEAITHSTRPNEIPKQLCFKTALDHFYHKKVGRSVKIAPDSELVTVICTGRKNRQIVKGLVPNKKYYIDLFGVHTKLENLTFLLNSSFIWFNRSRPISLQNDSLFTFQLPETGRQAVFVYKVPSHNTCSKTKLYTIPCGRNIRLKIISQFNQNTTLMEFRKSSVILLNNKPGDKFVFKFSTNEKYNNRSPKKIRIMISCSETFSHLIPQLPENRTIEQNFDETDCTITSITWNPSPDFRPDIWYCIYLIEINQRSSYFDDLFLPNICIIGTSPYYHPQLYQMQCIQNPIPRKIQGKLRIHHILTQLNPNRYYAVHVMLRLNNITLPYDKLLINTKSKCSFGLNSYETHRDSDDILPNDIILSSTY